MDEATRPRIAVVGAGFSGTLLIVQLIAELTARGISANLFLIDKTDRLNRGIAYDTEVDLHLLNVPAEDMSALPFDRLHFYNWAAARYHGVTPSSFLSRKIYGRYLSELFQSSIKRASGAAAGSAGVPPASNQPGSAAVPPASKVKVTVEVIKDTACSFDRERNVLKLASGRELVVNRLILATGNLAPKTVLPASAAPLQPPQYINDPWSNEALAGLRENEDILLIGTGLTTVDLILDLYARGHKGRITALSRKGLLPQAHLDDRQTPASAPFVVIDPPFPATARAMFQLVRRSCAQSEALSRGAWRSCVNSLRPHTQSIWKAMPDPEKKRLLRHCKSIWETHRHRMAPDVAAIIASLIKKGQLEIVAARIAHIESASTHLAISIRRRRCSTEAVEAGKTPGFQAHAISGQALSVHTLSGQAPLGSEPPQTLTVARIINCTGPDIDLRNCQDSFIASLIESNCVQPDPLGLGLKTAEEGVVLTRQGPSPCISAMGALRKGHLWETTAVPELRVQAQEIAKNVVATIVSTANQAPIFGAPVEQMLYYGVPI